MKSRQKEFQMISLELFLLSKPALKDSQMNSLISEIHCRLSRDTITIELRKIYIKILYMY